MIFLDLTGGGGRIGYGPSGSLGPNGHGNGRNIVTDDNDVTITPRVQKKVNAAVKQIQSPYYGLQDAPSPVGRLSDRIDRLRQRCIDALGNESFAEARNFLKHFEESHAADGRY